MNRTGRYSFNGVQIYPEVHSGLVLERHSLSSGYDEASAEFYDIFGEKIFTVPESRRININVYLEAGKIYAPVITAIRPAKTGIEYDSGDMDSESSSGGGGCCSVSLVCSVLAVLLLGFAKS